MKNYIKTITAGAILALLAPQLVNAQYIPGGDNMPTGLAVYSASGHLELHTSLSNEFQNGITFDSASTSKIYANLFTQLAEVNNTTVAEIVALFGNPVLSRLGGLGDGWSGTFDNEGNLNLTHVEGRPGTSYALFNNENSPAYFVHSLHNALDLFEFDGVEGYNPETDYSIRVSEYFIEEGWTATSENGLDTWSAPSQIYELVAPVPEPATVGAFAVLGLVGLLSVRSFRNRRKTENHFTATPARIPVNRKG